MDWVYASLMSASPRWLILPAALFGLGLAVVACPGFIFFLSIDVALVLALGLWGAGAITFFVGLLRRRLFVLAALCVAGVALIAYSWTLSGAKKLPSDPDPSAPPFMGGIALCFAVMFYVYVETLFAPKLELRHGNLRYLPLAAGLIAAGSSPFVAGVSWGLLNFMSEVNRQEEAVTSAAILWGLVVAVVGWIWLGVLFAAAKRAMNGS